MQIHFTLFFICLVLSLIKSRQYRATFPARIFFDPFRLTNDLTFLLGQLMNAIKRNIKLNRTKPSFSFTKWAVRTAID